MVPKEVWKRYRDHILNRVSCLFGKSYMQEALVPGSVQSHEIIFAVTWENERHVENNQKVRILLIKADELAHGAADQFSTVAKLLGRQTGCVKQTELRVLESNGPKAVGVCGNCMNCYKLERWGTFVSLVSLLKICKLWREGKVVSYTERFFEEKYNNGRAEDGLSREWAVDSKVKIPLIDKVWVAVPTGAAGTS